MVLVSMFPLTSFSEEVLPQWLYDEKLREIMNDSQERGGYTKIELLTCQNLPAIKYILLEM